MPDKIIWMQDIQAAISGGGDRRLRPPNNQAMMKCPRCDSLNTKFCYYNNYNLSQPRHFCKNCRRYWTKGGVLRNVPVGGGCRKPTKRNSKPKTETKSKPQSSSSESSSLTAATNTTTAAEDTSEPLMIGGQILDHLITSSEQIVGFEVNPTYPVVDNDQLKMQGGITGGGGLDWVNNGGDQSLFDLTAAVDPSYWSQIPWTDNDHSLNYIP